METASLETYSLSHCLSSAGRLVQKRQSSAYAYERIQLFLSNSSLTCFLGTSQSDSESESEDEEENTNKKGVAGLIEVRHFSWTFTAAIYCDI